MGNECRKGNADNMMFEAENLETYINGWVLHLFLKVIITSYLYYIFHLSDRFDVPKCDFVQFGQKKSCNLLLIVPLLKH